MTEEQIVAIAKHAFPHAPRALRQSLSKTQRAAVRAKTGNTCHVCGILIEGEGQVDHIVPHSHGGMGALDNYLPICKSCNRLRWNYSPDVFKLVIQLGVFAKDQIRRSTPLGRQIAKLASMRLARNQARRQPKKAKT